MITVLVVADPARSAELDDAARRRPSLELLHAGDLEEALDRLARNRRIDAVLLLVDPGRAADIVEAVLEEDPAAPPLYVVGAGMPGARSLPGVEPTALLESLERALSG